MIFVKGDILNSKCQAIVIPVNCVGVMGAGLAKQAKARWPRNFEEYRDICARGHMHPWRVYATRPRSSVDPDFLINFPTKRHWRNQSRFDDLAFSLLSLRQHIEALEIKSIAIPKLGCGLGGLHWPSVRQFMRVILHDLPCEIQIYGEEE